MNFRKAVFYSLIIFSTQAWATDRYSQILNLADLTNNLYSSRYRITFEVNYLPPTEFKIFDVTNEDPEAGPLVTAQKLGVGGSPLIGIQIEIDQIDLSGNKIAHVQSLTNQVTSAVQSAPHDLEPMTVPIAGPFPQVSALPIENQKLLLSVQGAIHDTIQIQPLGKNQFRFIKRLQTTPENLILRLTIFDQKTKQFYESAALIPPFREDPTNVQCSSPGQSRTLRDISIGQQTVHRIEYCYPTKSGFERVVLPVQKPATTPFEQFLLTRMLQNGGEVAKNPLIQIPASRLTEINCHGYSLLAVAGKALHLPAGATWIEGLTTSFAMEGTNPFATLLQNHFQKIKSYYQYDEPKVLIDPQVHAGDLIVFTRGDKNALHSAVVIQKPNSNQLWLEHKLEEGPVVNTPLENIQSLYPYLSIEIYRYRGN